MFQGVDLYSDTMTKPTAAMLQSMLKADLGDEQKGEDPTTCTLEQRAAELLGHSAALFFPSATMANQVALQLLCQRGDELLAAENCHLFFAEAGGPAIHAGIMAKPIPTASGIFTGEDVRAHYRSSKGPHYPVTRLVSVENTTNMGGGIAWSLEELNDVFKVVREFGLKTHLDGSRLLNAAIKTGLSPKQLAGQFDTVTLCLSKGLGCPTGALLAFDQKDWDRVRRLKQLMGGSLRQSGVLAACGLYALEHHVERLQEDHDNASKLGDGLSTLQHLLVENNPASTNMVFFRWTAPQISATEFSDRCLKKGLRFTHVEGNRFRAVTHLGVSSSDIDKAISIVKEVTEQL